MSRPMAMVRVAGVTLVALLAARPSSGGPAGSGGVVSVVVAPGASLVLDGDSSLHRYSARAEGIEVAVGLDVERLASAPQAPDLEALIRGRFIKTFQLTVPVGKLASGERGLDERLRKALRGGQYRDIRFRMDSYDLPGASPGGAAFAVLLHGRLSLAGTERRIDVAATGTRIKDGIRFTGSKELLMTDYKVKPPTLVLGAIKTANLVTVKFDLTLQPGREAR